MSHEKVKRWIDIIILVVIGLTAVVLFESFDTPATRFEKQIQTQTNKTATFKIRDLRIEAELARTQSEQEIGLAGRAILPELEAMLFVFDRDVIPTFWMKGVLFPIDILWIDKNLQVAGVAPNVSPSSFPRRLSPARPIRYVLEINAGLAENFNIHTGDMIIPQ